MLLMGWEGYRMELTAGKAAKRYRISRTALLYYDEIGLVKPSGRSGTGYRLYSEADLEKLGTVIAYREAGISLEDISKLLSGTGNALELVLLKRLGELNNEIIAVKKRQAAVLQIIQSISKGNAEDVKQSWRAAKEASGMHGAEADRLHADFEEHSPLLHARFLQALGFTEDEIKLIRETHSRNT
jgi:MerR family transcriptional regulator, thiopeptide resistance regulator